MPAKQNSAQTSLLQFSVTRGRSAVTPMTTAITTLPPGTFTIGAGVPDPTAIQQAGALYSRTDGKAGTYLYRSDGTKWVPIL